MKFGFLKDKYEFEFNDFLITVVPDYDEIINGIYKSANVSNGWIYGPRKELKQTSNEKKIFNQTGPIISDSFYRISPTHEIISNNKEDEDHLRFLILGYSFLQGLYLVPENYSYLNRTPYEPGKLNGLLLVRKDRENGMKKINHFYLSSTTEEINQMFASLHWFLVGQSYNFQWDKFDAQYKVLDGIFRLSGIKTKTIHAERPVVLAKKYNILLPQWALLDDTGKSTLSKQRNELIHEAKYGGMPIGYSYPSENHSLEFTSFNTKLISATLGINTPYLRAEPKNRCQWAWDIPEKP